jgi:hypothetical protein
MPVDHGRQEGGQLQRAERRHAIAGEVPPNPDVAKVLLHPLWMTLDVPVSFIVPGLRTMIFFIMPLSPFNG